MRPRLLAWTLLGVTACGGGARPGAVGGPAPPPPGASAGALATPAPSGAPAPAAAADDPHAHPAADDAAGAGEEEEIDDEIDDLPAFAGGEAPRHPLDGLPEAELERLLQQEPERLGSVSLGKPNAGRLMFGVQVPESPLWVRTDPGNAWGTAETVEAIGRCLGLVHQRFPGSAPIWVGHVSAREGGPLRPHKSHQAGRDVDLGLWYLDGSAWYRRATPATLDRARVWALMRAFIVESDVEMILVDHALQGPLREHALAIGEDAAWIDGVFLGGAGLPPLVRHAPGHATHLHVRFFSPVSRETARRLRPVLTRTGRLPRVAHFVSHRARRGDTLGSLARRYGTTVPALRAANGLRGTRIVAGAVYRIPRSGAAPELVEAPVRVPPRRLPPHDPEGPALPADAAAGPARPPR